MASWAKPQMLPASGSTRKTRRNAILSQTSKAELSQANLILPLLSQLPRVLIASPRIRLASLVIAAGDTERM
jgi:hypothetical protein